ncbi:MAG: hypothetical protein WA990_08475 [Rubrobacteraceae bacterium]
MGKERESSGRGSEYTVIGVIGDGAPLNQAVKEIREVGVGPNDLTVILKRQNPGEPEPFPTGTRYIVVPNDRRGLEVPLGFATAFVVFGTLFLITTPAIGLPAFVIFVSLAAILVAGSLTRVGVSPILTEMEAPREESETWNEGFEMGQVLVFASTRNRRLLRPIREILQGNGAAYYMVDRRLEPRAVHQAILYRAGQHRSSEESVFDKTGGA